jgi:hypothetical protein
MLIPLLVTTKAIACDEDKRMSLKKDNKVLFVIISEVASVCREVNPKCKMQIENKNYIVRLLNN